MDSKLNNLGKYSVWVASWQRQYALVKKMVWLDEDLKVLQHADETMIGDRGINLSGKAEWVSPAVYADQEMYLLDDILTAVDLHVSTWFQGGN